MQEKIIISGTGRCGTTFLMMLFTFLGLDTGYKRDNYFCYLDIESCSGMENVNIQEPQKIIKNPYFCLDVHIKPLLRTVKVKYMIIPIRDYEKSAESREKLGALRGGLWEASNKEEQMKFYYKTMAEYMLNMVRYDIPTIFLDFDRMVTSSEYLYEKLKPMMKEENVEFEIFDKKFQEVNFIQKRNRKMSPIK
jgi:hypothetical protein